MSDLNSLAKLWAHWLRLSDWKLSVFLDTEGTLEEDEYAHVRHDYKAGTAVIKICTEETYEEISCGDDCQPPYDPERLLVHELLHLRFAGVKYEDAGMQERFERGLNVVAEALVFLKRDVPFTVPGGEAANTKAVPSDLAA